MLLTKAQNLDYKPSLDARLEAWYRASDVKNVLTTETCPVWPDMSRYRRSASQATSGDRPQYVESQLNGRPCLRFTSSAEYLGAASFFDGRFNSGITIFALAKSSSNSTQILFQANSGALVCGYTTNAVLWNSSGLSDTQTLATTAPTKLQVIAWRYDGAKKTIRLNGRKVAEAAATGSMALSGALTIGASGAGATPFAGDLYELIIFKGALSDEECALVEDYLATEYALKTVRIACDGDSLTMASEVGEGQGYVALLAAWLSGYNADVINDGLGGETFADFTSTVARTVDPHYAKFAPLNICLVWGGTNDMLPTDGDLEAADTYAAAQTYCNARRAVGWDKILIFTATPRNTETTYNTRRAAYNALLRAGYRNFADGLIDLTTVPELDDPSNATYFADGTHFTYPAYLKAMPVIKAQIAQIYKNSLNTLLPY